MRDTVKLPVEPLRSHRLAPSSRHGGETTARQRREAAQAAYIEDKLAQAQGKLIPREEARQSANAACARLGKNLDGIPEQIAKRFDLPDTAISVLREMMDDIRVAMVKDLEPLLGKPEPSELQ